jgi:hypothetical protein
MTNIYENKVTNPHCCGNGELGCFSSAAQEI